MIARRTSKHTRRRFKDLSPNQQVGVVILGAIQLALLASSELDIQQRPSDQIVGRKLWWRAISLINFIGPLTYFRWGRKEPPAV